jgi:hypothetical protein
MKRKFVDQAVQNFQTRSTMPGWTGKLITSLGMISDKMDKSPPKTGKF